MGGNWLARNTMFINWSIGSVRRLKDKTACLLVRTRGLHLDEKHILCDGEPMAGALVDFGLYFFHNVHVRLAHGSAPYYYLPKMETHQETRLWNDVFKAAQDYMKVPQGELLLKSFTILSLEEVGLSYNLILGQSKANSETVILN